ncbi:hypothetical protein LJC53_07255, partial [Bacteroidales bacterium OttesenSCG-928-C03]|nr:hypothetical protein [Bacteroidales bacterium OttesenSCG-928-C03]
YGTRSIVRSVLLLPSGHPYRDEKPLIIFSSRVSETGRLSWGMPYRMPGCNTPGGFGKGKQISVAICGRLR